MDYLEKYKGQGGRRSIYDILSLDPNKDWNTIRDNYVATDMDKVVIGGNTFSNYGDFQFVWEKSYVKSPERSADGSIGNLNSYPTFVTPHLVINFSLMSIDDYRRIMRLDLEANEFVVECYDPIYNKKFKGKMYFATPQMAKLFKIAKIRFDGDQWEEFIELVGVQEYTVELIGTNSDLDLVSVRYVVNPPEGTTPSVQNGGEEDVYKGEEVVIGTNTDIPTETFGGQYKFKDWRDKNDQVYTNGYAYTINDDIVLYAQWEATNNHKLSFNYGVAHDIAENDISYYLPSYAVVYGKNIGYVPPIPLVAVKAKNINGIEEEFTPYYNGGWYKSPALTENSKPLTVIDDYWTNHDSSAYLLYKKDKFKCSLFIDYQTYLSQMLEYGDAIPFPQLEREGYTLDGWYTRQGYPEGSKFEGTTMPPYTIGLYARWVKK